LYDNFEDQYFSHASPFARIMENRLAASLTSVGVRTLTSHQRAQAARFGVRIIEMKDWNYDWINTLPERLYLSFDLDVLDPAFAPGVSHHEPGGLSVRQVISCLHKIKGAIIGTDIVEYNPDQDINEMTAMVGYKMLKEIWAKMG
jgi:arginase family enzyme